MKISFNDRFERIEEVIEYQAELFPKNIAYAEGNRKISYEELIEKSEEIKNDLVGNGIKEHSIVVFMLEKCLDYIIYLYAVWKNKCVYVPLNHNDDSERIRLILKELRPDLIITSVFNFERLKEYKVTEKILCIDEIKRNWYKHQLDITSRKMITVNKKLAYIIYTSGTTGQPKGVCVEHKSILNFVCETVKMFGFNRNTVLLCVKPLYFDASFTDLLCPQFSGGCTVLENGGCIMPRVFMKKIKCYNVSHVSLSPILLQLLTEIENNDGWSKSIKTISIGGDMVPFDKIKYIHNQIPKVKFFNRYGPTEATVVSSAYCIDKWENINKLSIGKPLAGVNFYVLDEHKNPVEIGTIGELYIGGIQVMHGYWNNEEITKKVLYDNIVENDILYKTGDLVCQGEDNNYYFVGRKGNVIKRRGYRISVIEVEEILEKCDAVADCVCFSVGGAGNEKLVAIVEAEQGKKMEIMDYLRNKLPTYMFPDEYYVVGRLSYNTNGKKDRRFLIETYQQGLIPILI